jgi:hypothetical protein
MTKIFSFLAVGVLGAGLVYSMNSALSLPDVHVSYSTNECVKVVNYASTAYSCENLPTKFYHVWTK